MAGRGKSIVNQLAQLKHSIGTRPKSISFELFPPKSDNGVEELKKEVERFVALKPSHFSVTYGAGGSTQTKTFDIANYIQNTLNVPVAAHLTCVGASKEDTKALAKQYLEHGITKIVALRGDMPGMTLPYMPPSDGFGYADELVAGLMEIGDFDISVAAYPETHPEATSAQDDLAYLKRKIDNGAKRAITQYCFDTDEILRFIDKARDIGITAPIVPGILIMNSVKQMISFSKRCGATVPEWVLKLCEGLDEYPHRRDLVTAMIAVEQCRLLMQHGVDEFHFYTLNRPPIVEAVCHALGGQS